MQIGLCHEGHNSEVIKQTDNVKEALIAFLASEGFTLETYSEFHKKLVQENQIVTVTIREDKVIFQCMSPDELYGIYKDVKHHDYINYGGLTEGVQGLLESFTDVFDRTDVLTFNDCIFDGEGNVIHLYGVKEKGWDGDTIRKKKEIIPRAERRTRKGGDFVQETHFKRNHSKTKRW